MPSTEVGRRVDACEAVTADIIQILNERIAGIDGDFDADQVKGRLCELLHHEYTRSIYGSTASQLTRKSNILSSQHSITSCMATKCADTAAELAAKEAEYEVLLKEEKQKEWIRQLEEQHRRDLDSQKHELERLCAEKNVKVARARFDTYNQEAAQETIIQSTDVIAQREHIPTPAVNQPSSATSAHYMDMSSLTQAFQNSIALNRLPMPEPFVFSGDPTQFIEWKALFVSLIDRKGISAADKLYYLKKYVGGPARRMLDGIFFRNDIEAYEDAWNKLNQQYGQPFVIQRAFRERLSKWPRIHSKDAEGLRNFSDFLNACQNAMPHVKGLDILNDCEENQKLTQKLPDWAASRWNRKVRETLNSSQDFPSFQVFTAFLSMEADIACNPITSFNALHTSEPATEKRNLRDIKGKRASVLSTLTVTNMETKGPIKGGIRPSCMFCLETKHQLHACSEFMTKSLDEPKKYVKEKKLFWLHETWSQCKGLSSPSLLRHLQGKTSQMSS